MSSEPRETNERSGQSPDGEPELSVVLATDGVEQSRETISHLSAQSAAGRIELVLAMPNGSGESSVEGVNGLHSVRVIDLDPRLGTGAARATAIVNARAPVVVMAETHCFPEPDWAEALIEAHRGPWAAVGPVIDNENPDGPMSWGNLLVDYSAWIPPSTRGQADDLPGHNSSYKRALLETYADDLPRLLESETILHWDLRARGHRLFMEPAARTRHRNITGLIPSIVEHFHNGRTFGGLRSRNWSPGKRAVWVLAAPLIPLVRFARILRQLREKNRSDLLPQVLPMVASSLIAHAAGEMTGYLTGSGDSVRQMVKYELDRDHYVTGK